MKPYNDYRDAFKTQTESFDLKQLESTGAVPNWLSGAFISTGPGQFEIAGKHVNHWFDGYAMLKGFYFNNGSIDFRNRLVLSDTYLKNEFLDTNQQPATADNDYVQRRLTAIKQNYSYDNPNVNVCQLDQEAIAMTEVPSQSQFDVKTLKTIGHLDYQNEFESHCELAHPCYDPVSKRLINLATEFGQKTTYRFYEFDTKTKTKKVVAQYKSDIPYYNHSFCVTENYFILFFTPIVFNLANPDADFVEMLQYHKKLNCQFVVIDRHNQETKIFETDPFVCFHQANAYEKNQELIVDLCCYQDELSYEALFFDAIMKRMVEKPTYLTRFCLNLQNGNLTQEQMSQDLR